MKKILFILSLFISQVNLAQISLKNDVTTDLPLKIERMAPIGDTIFDPNEHDPIVINVNFHVINDDNGNRTIPIGEEQIMNVIRDLNIKFGAFEIYFKYQGFDQINETEYLNLKMPTFGEISTPQQRFPIDVTDHTTANSLHNFQSVNIFIVDELLGPDGVEIVPGTVSYVQTPNTTIELPNIFIMAEYFNRPVMIHEMGHVFYLLHTNRSGSAANGACEHVQRDSDQADYNAHQYGDRIIDTPASPAVYASEEVVNCKYKGNQVDCTNPGVLYKTHIVPIKNYMNVNLPADIDCQDHFTNGQGVYMRTVIDEALSDPDNIFTAMGNTVNSLYQPFEVIDVAGTNITSTTNLPGGVMVCRDRLRQHRFQKGFHYDFLNTVAPDAITAQPDDIPLIKNNMSSFKVKVNELNTSYYQTIQVILTRGEICVLEPYIKGSIVTMPFLGSYNMKVDSLNQREVNDPTLVKSLENNQYYIITKETESGAINRTIIYKN